MVSPRAAAVLALVVLGVAGLGGCADKGPTKDDDLAELISWFPGHYDTLAQAQSDEKAGVKPPHDRIALLVMPAYVPRLGHHVFYVQETAPDNTERVMSERLFSFDVDEKRGVVGLMYNFVEPLRWRAAPRNPQLLTSIMTEDVTPVGCELIWKRSGESFVANHDPKHCHRAAAGGASGPEATLTPDTLTLAGFEFRRH
jgi:hypothetical protein